MRAAGHREEGTCHFPICRQDLGVGQFQYRVMGQEDPKCTAAHQRGGRRPPEGNVKSGGLGAATTQAESFKKFIFMFLILKSFTEI